MVSVLWRFHFITTSATFAVLEYFWSVDQFAIYNHKNLYWYCYDTGTVMTQDPS